MARRGPKTPLIKLVWGAVLTAAIVLIVTAAYQVPYRYTLDVGSISDRLEPTYFSRFNAADRPPERDFRWSQADSYIRILPIANRMQLTLTYLDVSPGAPRTATFTTDEGNDGGLSQAINNSTQPRTLTLVAHAADTPYILRNSAGNIYEIWFGGILHITIPLLQNNSDPRALGLAVDRVEVATLSDGLTLPPRVVLLMFVFVVLMPYLLLLALRVRAHWALLVGLLVAGGVGLLLVIGRRSLLDLSSHMLIVAVLGYYVAAFFATKRILRTERQKQGEEERGDKGGDTERQKPDKGKRNVVGKGDLVGKVLRLEDMGVKTNRDVPNNVGEVSRLDNRGVNREFNPSFLLWIMRVVAVGTTAVVLVAPYLPQGEALPTRKGVLPMYVPWWQFYKALPLWFTIASMAIVLVGGALSFTSLQPGRRFRLTKWDGESKIFSPRGKIVVAFLSLPFFWVLRVRTSVGDTLNMVGALARHTFFENEFLDFCLHSYVYRAFEAIAKPSDIHDANLLAQAAYQIPSALMGGVFVYMTLRLAERLTSGALARTVIAGFVLTTGTLLLYFGYVESYPTPYLVALIFTYTAIGALRNRAAGIRWSAFWLALSIVLHQQMIFLGPAFVFVVWWRASRDGRLEWARLWREIAAAALVGLAPLLLLWAMATNLEYTLARWYQFAKVFGGGSDGGYFKPLLRATTPEEQYPILSGEYVLQIVNLQCLLAPLGLAIIITIFAQRWLPTLLADRADRSNILLVAAGVSLFYLSLVFEGKKPYLLLTLPALALFGIALWRGRGRIHQLNDPVLALLAILALFTAIFSSVWNPDLGWDDWNLLSANGIFINLLASYSLVTYGRRNGWLVRAAVIALPFLCVHLAGWVTANAFGLATF